MSPQVDRSEITEMNHAYGKREFIQGSLYYKHSSNYVFTKMTMRLWIMYHHHVVEVVCAAAACEIIASQQCSFRKSWDVCKVIVSFSLLYNVLRRSSSVG